MCLPHCLQPHPEREKEAELCVGGCVCVRKKQLWRVSHFLKCVSMLEFGVFLSVSVSECMYVNACEKEREEDRQAACKGQVPVTRGREAERETSILLFPIGNQRMARKCGD